MKVLYCYSSFWYLFILYTEATASHLNISKLKATQEKSI